VTAPHPIHVIFVCTGNICRSPMAERIAEKLAAEAGLAGVRFTSAGTSDEEQGNPIDPRAVRVLSRAGYRTADHRAHQITAAEAAGADLLVGMERYHLSRLHRLAPDANAQLITAFDPAVTPGSEVADPWYGPATGFEVTRAQLEAAMPGLLDWVRSHQAM